MWTVFTLFFPSFGTPEACRRRSSSDPSEARYALESDDGQKQIGFARVVSDGATFAYLCDDYIVEDYRGKGLGKWLMECILSHPDLQGLHRWVVVTRDIRLYTKVGFTPLKEPETYLEMLNPGPKPQSSSSEVG
jgi:GNAT superfamily N-acetyltransferase